MDITFAIIFVAIAAGAFYLLIHDELIRSRGALCSVWLSLGVSLMVWALTLLTTGATADLSSMQSLGAAAKGVVVGTAFAYLALGVACVCLPLAVYPAHELQAAAASRTRHRRSHRAEPDRADPDTAEAFEQFATSLDDPPAAANPTA